MKMAAILAKFMPRGSVAYTLTYGKEPGEYDAAHVPNVKFLSQISSTPVGFVTAKGSKEAVLEAAGVTNGNLEDAFVNLIGKAHDNFAES